MCLKTSSRPASHVNLDKHAQSLEGWRSWVEQKARVLRDNYPTFRHAERFGLITVHEKPVVFFFEQVAEWEELLGETT